MNPVFHACWANDLPLNLKLPLPPNSCYGNFKQSQKCMKLVKEFLIFVMSSTMHLYTYIFFIMKAQCGVWGDRSISKMFVLKTWGSHVPSLPESMSPNSQREAWSHNLRWEHPGLTSNFWTHVHTGTHIHACTHRYIAVSFFATYSLTRNCKLLYLELYLLSQFEV